MATIGFGSVRSCGVTTMAAGLAGLWSSDRDRLLVEMDPAGGTLAAVGGLTPEPGLVSLAASARRQGEPTLAFDHAQVLDGGVPVVCGPPSAERARSALSMLSGLLGRLGELNADVLCDHGRLDPEGENLGRFERSDVSVLACRPRLADLHALAAIFEGRSDPVRPAVVLVGDGPYAAGEVAEVFGTEVIGQLPWDPEAATAIGTISPAARQLSRTPLVRALRSLTDELATRARAARSPQTFDASASINGDSHVMEVRP
jgi:hypothetical protein